MTGAMVLYALVIASPCTLELVEYAVVLVQIAKLAT